MNRQQRLLILLGLIGVAILFLLPTIFYGTFTRSWVSKPIALGLDLSGGAHLVYQVQTDEAVKSVIQNTALGVRADLREQKIPVTRARVTDDGLLEVTLLSDRMLDQAKARIAQNFKDFTFVNQTNDSGLVQIRFSLGTSRIADIKSQSVEHAIETLRNRVDQFGVAEPLLQRVGVDRILLQMPGVTDLESVKKVVGKVAKLEFRLVPISATAQDTISLKNRTGEAVKVEDLAVMTGDAVSDAQFGMMNGQMEVNLSLTPEGTNTFRRITTDNVGRQLAIILDGVVYSSPRINEPIPGGHAQISGSFTREEARELMIVLRAGALPAPLKSVEERTVGPTLGKESIRKGVTSIIIGFVLIIGFMVFYYRKAGMVAVGTLFLNLILLVACLAAFGATLTLPGLAGLALTIGMAVDSNVLIFERIRDELHLGAGRDAAVDAGFRKALTAITDANVTHFISSALLYYFGTGSIRGFAVTLALGIATTLFCATFATRLVFDYLPLRSQRDPISI